MQRVREYFQRVAKTGHNVQKGRPCRRTCDSLDSLVSAWKKRGRTRRYERFAHMLKWRAVSGCEWPGGRGSETGKVQVEPSPEGGSEHVRARQTLYAGSCAGCRARGPGATPGHDGYRWFLLFLCCLTMFETIAPSHASTRDVMMKKKSVCGEPLGKSPQLSSTVGNHHEDRRSLGRQAVSTSAIFCRHVWARLDDQRCLRKPHSCRIRPVSRAVNDCLDLLDFFAILVSLLLPSTAT